MITARIENWIRVPLLKKKGRTIVLPFADLQDPSCHRVSSCGVCTQHQKAAVGVHVKLVHCAPTHRTPVHSVIYGNQKSSPVRSVKETDNRSHILKEADRSSQLPHLVGGLKGTRVHTLHYKKTK